MSIWRIIPQNKSCCNTKIIFGIDYETCFKFKRIIHGKEACTHEERTLPYNLRCCQFWFSSTTAFWNWTHAKWWNTCCLLCMINKYIYIHICVYMHKDMYTNGVTSTRFAILVTSASKARRSDTDVCVTSRTRNTYIKPDVSSSNSVLRSQEQWHAVVCNIQTENKT